MGSDRAQQVPTPEDLNRLADDLVAAATTPTMGELVVELSLLEAAVRARRPGARGAMMRPDGDLGHLLERRRAVHDALRARGMSFPEGSFDPPIAQDEVLISENEVPPRGPLPTGAVREQLSELSSRADAAEQRADAMESRADKAELRADDSAIRADAAERRVEAEAARLRDDHRRIADAEGRLDVHEELITELQAEGLISSDHATNLEHALRTARLLGMAVGVVMNVHRVSEVRAFEILKKASMDGNRKLRLVAEEVVLTGKTPALSSLAGRSER